MYVVLEGIDTCGKSTQIQRLQQHFKDAIFTKEPGGSEIGEQIRDMILQGENLSKMAEFFLFLADRAQHLHEVIKPNINKLVISDRSLISGVAYAGFESALEMNKFCMENIMPDICFAFKIPKDALLSRLQAKSHDKIESRGIEYLLEIQERIITSAKKIAKNTHIIDATQSIDSITNFIVTTIKAESSKILESKQ